MEPLLSTASNPVKASAGRAGARRRWAGRERRVIRLAELEPEEAEVIRALLRLKAAREAAQQSTEAA